MPTWMIVGLAVLVLLTLGLAAVRRPQRRSDESDPNGPADPDNPTDIGAEGRYSGNAGMDTRTARRIVSDAFQKPRNY